MSVDICIRAYNTLYMPMLSILDSNLSTSLGLLILLILCLFLQLLSQHCLLLVPEGTVYVSEGSSSSC